jgi:hypothetical protein
MHVLAVLGARFASRLFRRRRGIPFGEGGGLTSEAELHILRGRMHEGKVNKAKRGELVTSLPVGYYRADGDEIVFDPDEQVQSVVRLIFAKFEEFRSAAAVLRYFVQHKITIGIREHAGPERGELRWRRPKSGMILAILKHPIYTGAYVYGRRTTDQRRRARGMSSGSTPSPNKEDWQVFLPDKLPAYITWDQFCSNQKQLQKNRARMEAMGAAREGLPLLGGLVFCGRCGCRMVTCFKNRTLFRYVCCQKQMMYGDARCQNLAGRVVDALIAEKVLAALEPAALDLSLQAITDLNAERERLHMHWKQRLEGARYNTDRAFRQYNATEPENRLVARTLEKRWEKALHDQQQLEEEDEQFCRSQPNQLTEDDQAMIRELSSSIPALWNSTATSQVDRKTIVRHLIERIVVAVQGETEIVAVTVHWAGGFRSEHEIRRPVRSHEQLQDFQRLKKRIEELFDSGMPPAEIADRINHEGFRPPNRCAQFSGRAIWCFLRDQCGRGSRTYQLTELDELGPDEWLLADLAKELGIKMQNVHAWLRRGWVTGRQIASTQSHWILWANKKELERLHQLSKLTYRDRPYPKSLTTPRKPPSKE